ncbi:MAG: ATP-binding protein [Nanoarchaeota archaeon]|nr:ATP-binding protein [Nanoarchaeota archaeon]
MKYEELAYALAEQQKKFEVEDEKPVNRELIERVIMLLRLNMPIFITGVRRCGKSFLLHLIKERLGLKAGQYFYIDFNDERLTGFKVEDFQKVIDFLSTEGYEKGCYLFIDEIQEVGKWEKWIERIRGQHPILITGSNSKLMSKEISSLLTGRSLNAWLTPFSFKEFLAARGIPQEAWKSSLEARAKIKKAFSEFLATGGFPKRVVSGEKIIVSELFENILYRDVIGKFGKKLEKPIKEASLYLLSNSGKNSSIRNVSDAIGIKNQLTVKNILNAFENAFLFFFIGKFDYSIKKQIQNPKKAYCIDNGFLTAVGFRFSEDKGRLLENFVAIELKRRGREIFYSKDKRECDFIIKEGIRVAGAMQVCYELNKENKERELNGLLEAMDKFRLKEGEILTYDDEETIQNDGKKIRVIPAWKWALQ